MDNMEPRCPWLEAIYGTAGKRERAPQTLDLRQLPSEMRRYYIYVTEACNLRCDYCFVLGKGNDRHLTEDTAQKILAFIGTDSRRKQAVEVCFFGGEPLLRTAMIEHIAAELQRWSKTSGVRLVFGLTTNGTLLTEANCEMLKYYNVRVQLSLDGSQAGNDAQRHQIVGSQQGHSKAAGAFARTYIDNYLKYFGGEKPACRMTLSVVNLSYLTKSVRDLQTMGFRRFSIHHDTTSRDWDEMSLSAYEVELDKLFRYWADNRDVVEINLVDDILTGLVKKQETLRFCPAGVGLFGISIDGDIYPCQNVAGRYANDGEERPKLIMGNVETGIAVNDFVLGGLSAASGVVSGCGHDCSCCWAKWVCRRGCPYSNYVREHDVRVVNSNYCAISRINALVGLRWVSLLDDYRICDRQLPPTSPLPAER